MRRALKWSMAACAVLTALVLVSFALPVDVWRTGEQPLPPLRYQAPADNPRIDGRVWIDTDPACGTGRRRDPDDCLALLALAGDLDGRIAGTSTVFGNAPLDVTDRVAREFFALRPGGAASIEVHRGCAEPLATCRDETPAHRALADALRAGPLTVVALGPLTNLAAVLRREPALAANVTRLVAVMGRRPGHLFHPAEGRSDRGLLFGHGPVFRDLNAALDFDAVASVMQHGVPLTLLPYSAARNVRLTRADIDGIAARDAAGAWVAARSIAWIDFWRDAVGIDGFYPFDLMAAAYVRDSTQFQCADVSAWVGRDPRMWLPRPVALMVSQEAAEAVDGAASARGRARYCDRIAPTRPLLP